MIGALHQEKREMGDFVQRSVTRSAARVLAAPIEDAATFDTIVAGVVSVVR